MNKADKQKLAEYLQSKHLMFLASSLSSPWVAPVYYAADDNLDLFFISEPGTKHCRNIIKSKKVSCGISDSTQKVYEQKIGIQLTGVASQVVDENEVRYALALWHRSNPGLEKILNFENLDKINSKVYIVHPRLIKFFNEKLYGPEGVKIFKNSSKKEIVFRGLVDSESVLGVNLGKLNSISWFKEKNPDGDPEFFNVHKIVAKGKTIEEATDYLSKKIKKGWYAVFWNSEKAFFIFRNKIVKLPYLWTKEEFKMVVKYATSVGIEEIQFLHIKNSMKNW